MSTISAPIPNRLNLALAGLVVALCLGKLFAMPVLLGGAAPLDGGDYSGFGPGEYPVLESDP